ncbi:alkaline phosphatase family protein [Oceaniglobus trochenteri]|uniref:alkaline phosphatase family protein n=1 Tax=Oceaniglobus trochenteri TaxID=2763260 RepID=UPI001CFFFF9A|nr:alkaline phosphatase family protein [Oceaniglobus trochenteri]
MPHKNILFIMCDQLRHDYLGCTGHPHIKTPHIDALAARGVRFDRAYVQSPICGPSRMSFYTGRYCRSHGATWNNFPLRAGEMTLGDHLEPLGLRTALCGKTHMAADIAGMQRLGIDPESDKGRRIAECGFEVWDRLDGLHPDGGPQPSHYNSHLRDAGFEADNPWHDWANAAQGDDGLASGWLMENADKPARVDERHSETPYTTTRAMEFIEEAADRSWCLHLSYIKPHWPYIAPPPYHDMYGADDVIPVNRDPAERDGAHPVLAAYHQHRFSQAFSRDEVRERVIPAYMGLITQIDDQIGRLMAFLDEKGLTDETLIVFTSDHGDYLGDHWLGEKELFHDASARIPMILVDPSAQADATRGQVCDHLVEAIDLLPTFTDWAGGAPEPHILEGRSLLPLLRGERPEWRQHVFSEYDYSARRARKILDQPIGDCRLVMVFDGRWKMVHAEGFRPMLHDLETDPQELHDRGDDPACADHIARLTDAMNAWARGHHNRVTISDESIAARAGGELRRGYIIGFWDQNELDEGRRLGESGN